MKKTYWISPNRLGYFEFHTSYDCISRVRFGENANYYDVKILVNCLSNNTTPAKLIMNKWDLKTCDHDNYEIMSYFSNSDNIYSSMVTRYDGSTLMMTVPYNDSSFLGNDLSYYSLMKFNSLTLRCSSVILNDDLYLFLGRSGSGKSTAMKALINHYKTAKPVSDDHITINEEKHFTKATPPIWDEVSTWDCCRNVQAKNMILYFFEDGLNEIQPITDKFAKTLLLAKHSILFSYSYTITQKILEILCKISTKHNFFQCPVQNKNIIIKHIDRLLN